MVVACQEEETRNVHFIQTVVIGKCNPHWLPHNVLQDFAMAYAALTLVYSGGLTTFRGRMSSH